MKLIKLKTYYETQENALQLIERLQYKNRKYHNLTLQTNPRHREEEPQNTNLWQSQHTRKTIKAKATSVIFLGKMIAKLDRTLSNA